MIEDIEESVAVTVCVWSVVGVLVTKADEIKDVESPVAIAVCVALGTIVPASNARISCSRTDEIAGRENRERPWKERQA